MPSHKEDGVKSKVARKMCHKMTSHGELKKAEVGEKPHTGRAPKRSEAELRHARLSKMKNIVPALGNNNNRTK